MEGLQLRNVRKEGEASSIAASGTAPMGILNLGEMRELVASARVTYNASATAGATLNFYYSVDGVLYDTVPYASFDIDLAAGVVQESAIVEVPSIGYMKLAMVNNDTSYAVTAVQVFTAFSRWGDEYSEADKRRYKSDIAVLKGGI